MKQITVVDKNRDNLTIEIAELLGTNGINIESLSLETTDDISVVSLTVDRYDEALLALRDAGLQAVSEDALLIRVADEPGSLAKVALRFRDAEILVRSLRIIRRREGRAIVAVSVDRTAKACELLRDVLIVEK